jgi:hypothetical protein
MCLLQNETPLQANQPMQTPTHLRTAAGSAPVVEATKTTMCHTPPLHSLRCEVSSSHIHAADFMRTPVHDSHVCSSSVQEQVPQAVNNSLSVRAPHYCSVTNNTQHRHGGGRLNHTQTWVPTSVRIQHSELRQQTVRLSHACSTSPRFTS